MSNHGNENKPPRQMVVASQQSLPPQQVTAMEMLQLGNSVTDTATAVGVTRATIYNWLKHDSAFAAAYNQWHDEIWRKSARSRLRRFTGAAVETVEKAIQDGDARLAMQLLKGLGVIRPPDEAEKITDANEIAARMELERKQKSVVLRREKSRLVGEELMADAGF